MNIVQIADYLPSKPPRKPRQKSKSQYELYPLPFFKAGPRGSGGCTWDVTPTGDYTADCETGNRYAIEFLRTCDGTVGWAGLLRQIVADMIRAGIFGAYPDGHPKVNGIVIGFMSVIGRAVVHSPVLRHPNAS